MKTVLMLLATVAFLNAATNSRVPPPGIEIATSDREELTARTTELGREIERLRSALAKKPPLLELLPDVEIFHKAVDWPLRYDEFYRSNEVALARELLAHGVRRAQELREGKAPWLSATGLVVRGYLSKIDGSVQPYGLIVPAGYVAATPHRLDVWLHGRDNHLTELRFISDRQRSYGEFAPSNAIVLHPYGRYCNAFKFAGEVDVFEAMERVKKQYGIDEQRIALRGFSMGGAGVWHLAAHHPAVWAVAAPGAGFAETAEYTGALSKEPKPPTWEQKLWQLYDATDYAANFFNLPVIAYNGTEDKQRQAADVMERAMKAEGLMLPRVWGTNVGHKYTPEAKKDIETFVTRRSRKACFRRSFISRRVRCATMRDRVYALSRFSSIGRERISRLSFLIGLSKFAQEMLRVSCFTAAIHWTEQRFAVSLLVRSLSMDSESRAALVRRVADYKSAYLNEDEAVGELAVKSERLRSIRSMACRAPSTMRSRTAFSSCGPLANRRTKQSARGFLREWRARQMTGARNSVVTLASKTTRR